LTNDALVCAAIVPRVLRVVRISIAPVKALGLVHPASVAISHRGVSGDRRFLLVDSDNRLFNGKRCGSLATIHPAWDEGTRELELSFPDGSRVAGVVDLGGPLEFELHGYPHAVRLVRGPWHEAVSAFAQESLRLAWSEQHATDRGVLGGVASLVSTGSLRRLGYETDASTPLDGRRFRMTFEVDGVDAHKEDSWIGKSIAAGTAGLRVLGDVGRCVVTTHDPDTGRTDVDTLKALARYRRHGRTERLPFGVYASVANPGRVSVGDEVQVPSPLRVAQ
jgi:uncharacterized protein YcbX